MLQPLGIPGIIGCISNGRFIFQVSVRRWSKTQAAADYKLPTLNVPAWPAVKGGSLTNGVNIRPLVY
jgi:hypothetical protein